MSEAAAGKRRGRVLIFAYYFPPLGGAGSLRALSFVRHLPALGWDPVIVTPRDGVYGRDPSLPGDADLPVRVERTSSWEPKAVLRRWKGERPAASVTGGSDVEEARLGPVGRLLRDGLRRRLYFPDSARGWIGPAVAAARRCHAEAAVDVVLSSSPPVSAHVAASRFARAEGVPWVADWRDPWTAHLDPADRMLGRARRLEASLLGAATGLTAATTGLAAMIADRSPRAATVATVRNGFEPDDVAAAMDGGRTDPDRPFTILHAGTVYGRKQDLSTFVATLGKVADRHRSRPIRLRLMGKVDPWTRELLGGLPETVEVRLDGFHGHADSLVAMAEADLLLLLSWSEATPIGLAICPAKTYEYAATERRILGLADPRSELHAVVGGLPGVDLVGFTDADGIARSLTTALTADAATIERPTEALAGLTRARAAEDLAAALDRAVGWSPNRS